MIEVIRGKTQVKCCLNNYCKCNFNRLSESIMLCFGLRPTDNTVTVVTGTGSILELVINQFQIGIGLEIVHVKTWQNWNWICSSGNWNWSFWNWSLIMFKINSVTGWAARNPLSCKPFDSHLRFCHSHRLVHK